MSVSVCVCVCLSAIIFPELHVPSLPKFLRMLPMAVARSSSSGVLICYVLPVLWMTSCLLISQGWSTLSPTEVQCTRSLGFGCKLCGVIPVAGQQTHGTTFRPDKQTGTVTHTDRQTRSSQYSAPLLGAE